MKVLRYKNQIVSLENVLEVKSRRSDRHHYVAISYKGVQNHTIIDVASEEEGTKLLDQIYSILSAD